MDYKIDPKKALEYFKDKMLYTTGPVELSRLIEKKELNVIDVRYAEDFQKGHIPTAVSIPPEQWDSASDKLDKNKTNVLYCYSQVCHLAAKAAVKFAELGFPVMELEGGFKAWTENKLDIEH